MSNNTSIRFKGLGFDLSVEVPANASCKEAVAVFEAITSKVLSGMEFYNGTEKIKDLTTPAPAEITAVKAKHASAGELTEIRFKGLGFDLSVSCPSGTSCSDAIKTFESITSKVLSGMEFYSGTEKIKDLSTPAPAEITAVKAKHASAV